MNSPVVVVYYQLFTLEGSPHCCKRATQKSEETMSSNCTFDNTLFMVHQGGGKEWNAIFYCHL